MTTLAFDTETRGLAWSEGETAFLGTYADATGEWHADLSDPEASARYAHALLTADVLIAHNLKFDIHQTRETLGYDILEHGAELHDTDLMARVVFPDFRAGGYGLKTLGKVLLGHDADEEDAIKEMGKAIGLRTIKQSGAYFDIWRAYPDVMEAYARQDARMTYDLYELMLPKLDDAAKRVYELEMAVLPILARAEQRGIRVDQDAVRRLKLDYTKELIKVTDYLEAELGAAALSGEGSTEALEEALLGIGVQLHERTSTGKLSTNKYALQKFAGDFPQIAKLEEYRTLTRFLTTYIGAVEGRDVVHTDFWQFEAWTGRMSSRRPNMQNLPKRAGKEVRAVFVPREGHAFVVADYEGIEARLLAYYLNDASYQQMIADGHDVHAWMAAQIYGGVVDDYVKGSPGEKQRNIAKNTTYAIIYGAGAPRVADMNQISRDEAKALISQIKSSLPNYWHLSKRIRQVVEARGYVITFLGRHNHVKKDKAYVGMNAIIQGSAADIMKAGLVAVDKAVRDLGAIVLLVVHDEVLVEVPLEHAEECQRRVDAALVSVWDKQPPMSVESCIVTTSYADA